MKKTYYKGYNPGLICRGKQYREGEIVEESGSEICSAGMIHFCDSPLDVLDYYPILTDDAKFNEFTEVEPLGDIVKIDNKCASNRIKIGVKFEFGAFVRTCVDFLVDITKREKNSGNKAKIISACNMEKIGSAGFAANISSAGDEANISSAGFAAKIISAGDEAKIGSAGSMAKIISAGDGAKIGSAGFAAKIGSAGFAAKIISDGNGANISSAGFAAKIISAGNMAKISSAGDWAKISSAGNNCVIMCAGNDTIAKAEKGSWITLSEWKIVDGQCTPVCVKTRKVDGKHIKANTWYMLRDGKFQEVQK